MVFWCFVQHFVKFACIKNALQIKLNWFVVVTLVCSKETSKAHLLLHTVSSVHVFNVIQEIADRVHVAEMLTVFVNCLQHLIEGNTNLK